MVIPYYIHIIFPSPNWTIFKNNKKKCSFSPPPPPSLPSVSIEDVVCVRTGRQTEGLRKYTEESLESRAFSILFKGHHKNLDLIANTMEEAKHWVSGLEKIISNMSKLSQQQRTEQYPSHFLFIMSRFIQFN